MGDIIVFENHRKKDRKKYKTPQATESHHSTENLNEFIKYMGLMLQNIPDSPIAEIMEQHETETKKEFEQKYKDILSEAPSSSADRVSYFANVMSSLIPSVFHCRERAGRLNAYADFSEFYLSEFDSAYCKYLSANEKYKKEYPLQISPMAADVLEKELQNCLSQISLASAKSGREKADTIIQNAHRLFGLYHLMDDLFL